MRAVIYHNQKEYAKAIADYSKYLEFAKAKSDNVYYYRGVCYENLGKTVEACADYKKAKEQGNKYVDDKIKKLCNPATGGT
jgi:tetratricopeptide (TPR) repeat protein